MSDNDFGSLTEFFNSLVGALENPQDDPELAEMIEQALHEDAEVSSSGTASAPRRGKDNETQARQPANLGEHLLAAVGKAEETASGETDDEGDHGNKSHGDESHGDESRGDEGRGGKGDSGIARSSNGGRKSQLMGQSGPFIDSPPHARRAGQLVAAQLIQTIAKVA